MAINCEDTLRQALGRNLTDEEIFDLMAEARRLERQARSRVSAGRRKNSHEYE